MSSTINGLLWKSSRDRDAESRDRPVAPHGESMCLLDAVDSWDDRTITCRTSSHRDHRNPLRAGGRLMITAGLEYAAQAMGVHVGL